MQIGIGREGLELTFQDKFPETTKCSCGGESRVGIVIQEGAANPADNIGLKFICDLYSNEPDSMWPHDCVAIAVYFCKECLKPVALFNQA